MGPGFRRVRIAPNLGQFKEVSARMPHPRGAIAVKLHLDTGMNADIDLPAGTDGEFEWAGAVHALHAGANHLKLSVNK
jgi:hypothetical protein